MIFGATARTRTHLSLPRKAFERECESWFSTVSLPRGGGIYDGYIDFHDSPKWKNWSQIVPTFLFDDSLSYFQLLVPNPDTVRFSYVIDRLRIAAVQVLIF